MASVDKVQCVKQARGDALSKVGLEAGDVSIDLYWPEQPEPPDVSLEA